MEIELDFKSISNIKIVKLSRFLKLCYASTSYEDIRESYAIEKICKRLQAMQAIT